MRPLSILSVIATTAAAVTVLTALPAAATNHRVSTGHQVVITKPTEIKNLATKTSKTYRLPDGGLRTVIEATPMATTSHGMRPMANDYDSGTPTCQLDTASSVANCAGTSVQVGKDSSTKRVVLAFDLSAIYRNAVVTDASLGLNVTARANSTADSISGMVVTRPWDTNATWSKATSSTNWANGGGDFTTTPAFTIGNATTITDYFPRMTQAVSDWVSGKAANDGLVLMANESVTNTLTFDSANSSVEPPLLTVEYDYDTSPRASSSFWSQTIDDRMGMTVNLGNGDLRVAADDLTVPGVDGLNLDMVRAWSSLRQPDSREFGNAWQFDYNEAVIYSENDGEHVILPGGTPGKFFWNGSGYSTPPGWNADLTRAGTTWVLKYRRSGQTWTFGDVPGASWESTLSSVADRNGNSISFGYSSSLTVGDNGYPVLTGITDSFGNGVTVHHNTSNLTDKITDASGRHSDYTFSGGRLATSADVAGKTTSYGYDSNGYLNKITTPAGRVITFTYGFDGRVSTITRVTNIGAGTGPTWYFNYNPYAGSPLLGTTTVTDPDGHDTVYTRDTSDRITNTHDALGHDHSTAWNTNSDPTTRTDALSAVQTLTYNATTGNLTKVQAPNVGGTTAGNETDFAYTDSAHPYQATQATDAEGNHLGYTYNTPGNVTRVTNDRSSANHYDRTFNADGTIATQSDSAGVATGYTYSGHRLTSIDNPSTTGDESFTYDSVGRLHTHTDGKGQVTTYNFNTIDRLTSISYNGGASVSFTYDDDGNLTGRTDASGTYVFKWDLAGRPYEKDFPGSGSSSVSYDYAGNVASYTNAGGTVNYNYDAANNVTKLAEPGGSCSGTISKCTTFGYDSNNNRASTTYPNGVVQTVTYDTAGRAKTIVDTNGASTLKSLTYSYANTGGADQGLLQSVTDNVSGNTTSYGYDVIDELTSAVVKNSSGTTIDSWTYTYDGNGNRLSSQRLGNSAVASTYSNADGISTTGSTTWTLDSNANLTAGTNGFSATYNDRDQTTSITQAGGSATSQSYADIGQHERTASGSTAFLTGILGLQSETTGTATKSYTRDPYGNPISVRDSSNTYYYLTDDIGSVIGLTNASGAVAQSFGYDPYGQVLTTGITVDSRFKFAGGEYDSATKLYHLGQRYYDPAQGRWTQRDTFTGSFVGGPGSSNRFAYADDNPVNYVDPSGQVTIGGVSITLKDVAAGIGGAVGIAALTTACGATAGAACLIAAGAAGGLIGSGGGAVLAGATPAQAKSYAINGAIAGAAGGGLVAFVG